MAISQNELKIREPNFNGTFQMNLGSLPPLYSAPTGIVNDFRQNQRTAINQLGLRVGNLLANTDNFSSQLAGKNILNQVGQSYGVGLQEARYLGAPKQQSNTAWFDNYKPASNTETLSEQINNAANTIQTRDPAELQQTVDNINQSSVQTYQENQHKAEVSEKWNKGLGQAGQALNAVGAAVGGKAGNAISGAGNTLTAIKNAKGAGFSGAMGIVGAASDMLGSFMPEKTEYSGTKGDITQGMDSAYDAISNAAAAFGPWGMAVSGIMKGGKLLGQGLNALGGGTDGMTTTDAILGSSFFNLTPIGMVNGFGGKRADTITKDNEAFETVGASYSGSNAKVDAALVKSGKKYGALSSGARKKANQEIAEAKRQQNIISNISDQVQDQMALQASMPDLYSRKYQLDMLGGYDQSAVRVGREGMSLDLLQKNYKLLKATKGAKIKGNKVKENKPQLTYNSPEIIAYAKERFPILNDIELNILNDPSFTPNINADEGRGNYGDLEYVSSKYDTLPYYKINGVEYVKPDIVKGKSVTIYNSNLGDKANEWVTLDALTHGLRDQDTYYQKNILPQLEKAFTSVIDNALFWYVKRHNGQKPEGEEEIEIANSAIDGMLRDLLVKDGYRETYHPTYESAAQEYLQTPEQKQAFQTFLDYINKKKYHDPATELSDVEDDVVPLKEGGIIQLINPEDLLSEPDIDEFKEGGSIQLINPSDLANEPDEDELDKFKEGGAIISPETIANEPDFSEVELLDPASLAEIPDVEEFKEGGSIDSDEYSEIYKLYPNIDPKSINIIKDTSAFTDGNNIHITSDEDLVHELSHYVSQNKPNEALKEFYENLNDDRLSKLGADLNFVKRTGDPGEFYQPAELEARLKAAKYKSKGQNYTKEFFQKLRNSELEYGQNMRDLLHMFNDDTLVRLFGVSKFKEGGAINVIPDGALHARLHHMEDADDLTKKGIPVVDNEGEQQAEVEVGEIIFRLEVTKKLEELEKKYYSEETSQKEKDEVALEAGKLLTEEILYNTDDKTKSLI